MIDPVSLSERTMHFWYLFYARDERIKPVERIRESYGVGTVENIEVSQSPRGINRNYRDSSLPRRRAGRPEYRSRRIPEPPKIPDPDRGQHIDTYA